MICAALLDAVWRGALRYCVSYFCGCPLIPGTSWSAPTAAVTALWATASETASPPTCPCLRTRTIPGHARRTGNGSAKRFILSLNTTLRTVTSEGGSKRPRLYPVPCCHLNSSNYNEGPKAVEDNSAILIWIMTSPCINSELTICTWSSRWKKKGAPPPPPRPHLFIPLTISEEVKLFRSHFPGYSYRKLRAGSVWWVKTTSVRSPQVKTSWVESLVK